MSEIHDKPQVDEAPKVDLAGNSWELPTDLRIMDQVRNEIERRLKELNWGDADQYRVILAFDELIINAIAHGNQALGSYKGESGQLYEASVALSKGSPSEKKVFVKFAVEADRASGEVRDQGQGFEPTNQADQAVTGNLMNPYGKGYLVLKRTLDQIQYQKEDGIGTTVTFSYTRKEI